MAGHLVPREEDFAAAFLSLEQSARTLAPSWCLAPKSSPLATVRAVSVSCTDTS